MDRTSKLYFRYGTMSSGKSTLLLQVANNYAEIEQKVMLIKPSVDTKGGDLIVSRLGIKQKVDLLLKEEDDIKVTSGVKCILVDEAQFLTAKQVNQLQRITKVDNIPVICYGIRTDFKTNGFPGSIRLLEIADDIEEIKTICSCGKKAVFTVRKVKGNFVFEGEQVAKDEENDVSYRPICGKCYIKTREGL